MYGKPVADEIDARVRTGVAELRTRHKLRPSLVIVQVGRDPASERYIRKKIESCERLEMRAELRMFDETISAADLKEEVVRLSRSPLFHGILVQLPLPRHIEEPASGTNKFDIFDAIAPEKDVDGIGREAAADLYRAQQPRMRFLPATALAVRRMMSFYKVPTEGKLAVVIGRNDITAKPVVLMLGGRMCNAAAIWIHRYVSPQEQAMLIRAADILVTSVGSPQFRVTADMLQPGVAVFDIATRVDEKGKLNGDVDFEAAKNVASFITPVPKGIGPVTVAALNENLLRAARFAAGEDAFGYSF
jgi:methylenetetrahydrofolate dehydrogenase (NADP+)/methenyltetrahydrofolate cyclohydrolase